MTRAGRSRPSATASPSPDAQATGPARTASSTTRLRTRAGRATGIGGSRSSPPSDSSTSTSRASLGTGRSRCSSRSTGGPSMRPSCLSCIVGPRCSRTAICTPGSWRSTARSPMPPATGQPPPRHGWRSRTSATSMRPTACPRPAAWRSSRVTPPRRRRPSTDSPPSGQRVAPWTPTAPRSARAWRRWPGIAPSRGRATAWRSPPTATSGCPGTRRWRAWRPPSGWATATPSSRPGPRPRGRHSPGSAPSRSSPAWTKRSSTATQRSRPARSRRTSRPRRHAPASADASMSIGEG